MKREANMHDTTYTYKWRLILMTIFLISCSGERPKDIGVYDSTFSPCPKTPNCISSDAIDSKHKTNAFELNSAHAENWKAIYNAVDNLPNTKIITFNDRYLHAECSSAVFGFVDDLQLHLRNNTKHVAIKSAARLGYSDFGVNQKRIEQLRNQLLADKIIIEK